MFTFLNRYILVVFLLTPTCLVAQNRQDTLSAGYTDTPAEKNSDSLYSDESADDNLSLPVADSSSPAPKKLREVPAKQVKLFRDDPEYAYANDPEYWRKEPYREPGVFFRILFSSTLRWALLTFVALLILYGIYRLAKENNFGLLIRNLNQKSPAPENEVPDESMDYDDAILRSQAEGDYGLAVRYLYLRMIRMIKEKSGLSFRDSSTNTEIIRAMGTHPQLSTFRWLTTAYEYVFYGGFVPNEELYERLKNKFELFQKTYPIER